MCKYLLDTKLSTGVKRSSKIASVRKGLRVYGSVSIAYFVRRQASHELITSKNKNLKIKKNNRFTLLLKIAIKVN